MTGDAAAVRFPPPLVFALAVGAGWALGRFAAPLGLGGPYAVLATALAAVGLVALGWAVAMMLRSGQNPEPWKPTPELLPTGIYRFSRNPMYAGMFLVQLALALWLDHAWIAITAPLALLAVFHIAVKPEERYLEEKFGDSYRAYKAQVRRWI